MDGRIDPPVRRGIAVRSFAGSAVVVVARTICILAGLAAYGLSLVGFLSGTVLGMYGAVVGSVLLLLGIPWSPAAGCFVAGTFSVLMLVAAYEDSGQWTTPTIFTLVAAVGLLSMSAYLAYMRSQAD
jgi:hypothetical protein